MKLIDLKVSEFKDKVASSSPAPGGGSVSALASTLGTSLLVMVGLLTTSKKKFKTLDPITQDKFNMIETDFTVILEELTLLIDKDTDAFNLIMAAYQLPKATSAEIDARNSKILEGTIEAIKVPFKVVELSLNVLKNVKYILEYGNKNTVSDIGVSVLMLYAGLEGAILNVKINLSGLTDLKMRDFYFEKTKSLLSQAKDIKDEIINKIYDII